MSDKIEALLEEFLLFQIKMDIYAPSTVSAVRSDLRGFIRYLSSQGIEASVDAFDTRNVSRYFASQRPRVKQTTIHRWRKSLNALGQWFTGNGYIASNPITAVKIGRVVSARREFLFEIADAARFLTVPAQTGLLPEVDLVFCTLGLFGGLRRSELQKLKWKHVCLDAAEIRIYNSKCTERKQLPDNLDRVVPMCTPVRQALQSLKMAVRPSPDDPVLFVKEKRRLTKEAFYKAFHAVRAAMGLNEDIVPHCLRHNFAGSLVAVGATLADVAFALGHAAWNPGNRTTVTERYITSSVSRVRTFVEKYAEMVTGEYPVVSPDEVTPELPITGANTVADAAKPGAASMAHPASDWSLGGGLTAEQLAEAVAVWGAVRPGDSPASSREFSVFVRHLADRFRAQSSGHGQTDQ